MAYRTLRSRSATAAINALPNLSPGVWAVQMDTSLINIQISFFELYHLVITGPAGSSMQWFVNNIPYESTPHGDLDSWNPPQPLELTPNDTLQFVWSNANGTVPPTVTAYFRYDTLAQ